MNKSTHRKILDEVVSKLPALASELDGSAIFVTGASGFLASSLLAFLSELGRQHGVSINLAASARRPPEEVPLFNFLGVSPPTEWHIASVQKTKIPKDKKWIVIHTASFGAPSDYMREPLATFSANTDGIFSLFEQLNAEKCERMVYFSSAEVYGQPPDSCIPTSESFKGAPDLFDPRSIYGESKRMAEVLGLTLSKEKGIPFTVIRPWNVYGPGQRKSDGRVPVDFFWQLSDNSHVTLISDGSPRRSFCHVWESMAQITYALRHENAVNEAFNIGKGGNEIAILALAQNCAKTVGLNSSVVNYNAKNKAPGMTRCQPDVSKIQKLMGDLDISISLDAGLETCKEWVDYLSRAKNK